MSSDPVPSYDLFNVSAVVTGTVTVALGFDGSAVGVVCGPNYLLKLHRANLTNAGTVGVTLSFYGVSTVTGLPTPLPLPSYYVGPGTTILVSELDTEIFVASGYSIAGSVSAGTVTVQGVARFAPG